MAALFRPPIDIIARLDWDYLLPSAREKNQWVLVNIQDPTEFACQVLNRDCWSDENVKNFIKSNMVFWQVYNKSPEGARICGYYGVKTFPAIFIIDPRTAEKVHTITAQEPKEMLNACKFFIKQVILLIGEFSDRVLRTVSSLFHVRRRYSRPISRQEYTTTLIQNMNPVVL